MLKVTVYPENIYSGHISQIYTGLYDLAAERKISLKFTLKFPRQLRISIPYTTLWVCVEDSKNRKQRNVCFDMHDSGRVHALDRLRLCDVYFKRSFDQRILDDLEPSLRKKIFPYGLNYACRSRNQRRILQRLLAYNRMDHKFRKSPINTFKNSFQEILKAWAARLDVSSFNLFPPLADNFEIPPDVPAEPKILFQTHLWKPGESPRIKDHELNEINEMRVETVRALRSEFGDQFIGGIYPTPFAQEKCPDCLATRKTDKKNYMNLVKRYLIGVTTTGLHDSNGWKLPEYIAASRCVITEPLRYSLPVPLEQEKNYLLFNTPAECVANVKMILSNPNLGIEMRHNNYNYYLKELKPRVLINKCLTSALND